MNAETPRKPLRLWPGVAAAVLIVLVAFVVPVVVPGSGGTAILGGVAGGLAIVVWWLFFSRAPWSERVGAIVLMVAGVFATRRIVHPSIANAGMGMMMYFFAVPVLSLALVSWAVASRRLSSGPRRASMVATILLACGLFALVRTGGVTGDAASDFHWRWTPTPEERLLAQAGDEPVAPSPAPPAAETPAQPASGRASVEPTAPASPPAALKAPADKRVPAAAPAGDEAASPPTDPEREHRVADWPGFRGPARDGVVRGVRIETDWSHKPPVALWRRPIGPGWSSFAVDGNRLYTQEQRGNDELVSSYDLASGKPVWIHRDAARFWESNAGPGPRATPTLGHGRVYTLGGTGILNALDGRDGSVVWSRNAVSDTGATVPPWGIASSPLVVGDVVVVATSGRLAAYDAATGKPRWFGPKGGGGYSSPHLVTIDGVAQILLLRGARTTSVSPADGTLLWEHSSGEPVGSIVQPAQAANGDLLIAANDVMGGTGMRRIAVARGPAGWTVEERWTSRGLKPYFNDFVVHKGHAFGFDASILACVDLADGTRKWKGGRYGHGQLVLLPDQDLLLVLSEEGELALVQATPDQFTELARLPAIKGKTWNHPVLVRDVLLVRNGEEMAAFRVPLAKPRAGLGQLAGRAWE
jgi:outer membrane protein assembly factor BamB